MSKHTTHQPQLPFDEIEYGRCQCGCGQKTSIAKCNNPKLGHIAGQPVRYIVGHNSRVRRKGTPEQRFWAKVNKIGPVHPDLGTRCWVWTGSSDQHGYGGIRIEGKHVKAHRFSYALAHGKIPKDFDIAHRCDRPSCVRVEHLFLATHQENMHDSIDKGRAVFPPDRSGLRSGSAKFSDDEIRRFRREFAQSDKSVSAFAAFHDVPLATMWRILKRKMYKDVK